MTPWANRDAGSGALGEVQRSLTVRMIMTPRVDLKTCRREDNARQLAEENKNQQFSYIPVTDDGEIIGIYNAERWLGDKKSPAPDREIGDDYSPLSENFCVTEGTTIVDFMRTASEHPVLFVAHENKIVGLVTLSDLQKLPARVALFSIITELEMVISNRIQTIYPDPENWLNILRERRRELQCKIDMVKKNNNFVNEVVLTQIYDKLNIIKHDRCRFGLSDEYSNSFFNRIKKLRDKVAHGNYYSETPTDAQAVCSLVSKILSFRDCLLADSGVANENA